MVQQLHLLRVSRKTTLRVVGKEQVVKGRHMHWLRVDVYYEGDRAHPAAAFPACSLYAVRERTPVRLCVRSDRTVHSTEGLNDMVYNRCIGTRYCSNNCPYKVRRFNFLLFQDWETPQYKMMRNPDVSIRSRGVMEKVHLLRSAHQRGTASMRNVPTA